MRGRLDKMKKCLILLLILLVAALPLSGCSMYNDAIDEYVGGLVSENEQQNADEPKATVAPLTVPMYTDRKAVYQYYNAIAVGDTLESLTEKYGEPTKEENENGVNYTWIMEDGYGFCATFFDDGVLSAKVLYYEDIRQLAPLSKATGLNNVSMLSNSYTLDTVKGILGGRGMQIAAMLSDSTDAPQIQYLYCWIDETGDNVVQVLFDKDGKISQVVCSFADEEKN